MNFTSKTSPTAHVRSSDPTGRDKVITLALVLAPAVIAAGWSMLMPATGPTNAYAAIPATPGAAVTTPVVLRKPAPDELEARRYCQEVCAKIDAIAPPTSIPGSTEQVFDHEEPIEDEEVGAPMVNIASILRDAQGRPSVYADGMLYTAGDVLVDGWVIEAIDLPSRTVTLRHPQLEEPVTLAPGR